MATATPPSRSVWRVVAVVFIAFIGLANTLPDISLAWHPFSDFGMQLDSAATVIGVDAGKSAGRAGVRPGDSIDLGATPLSSRQYVTTGFAAAPEGKRAVFAFTGPGGARHVELVAEPRGRSLVDNLTNSLLMLTFGSMISIAAALVLLRPSKMTWAFFLFAAFTGIQSTVSMAYLPMWAFFADTLIWSLSAVGEVGAAVVLGLSLNSMHKRAERAVDAILFRSRRRAEQRLVRVGSGLLRADSAGAVTQAIVSEPVEALALLSSAVFRRDGDGNFVRAEAIGWDECAQDALDPQMPVVLQLSAATTPLGVADGRWPSAGGSIPSRSSARMRAARISIPTSCKPSRICSPRRVSPTITWRPRPRSRVRAPSKRKTGRCEVS